jgi:hypothetical protein
MIFGLTVTLEKPTRGKPVKEGFLLFVSFREISFTAYSSSKITQTYLRVSSTKLLMNSPRNAP